MTKEFHSPNDEAKFPTGTEYLGLGHLELFSHSALWFSHLPSGDSCK
jgi:hypothetical protein